jgi:hypothetical protein
MKKNIFIPARGGSAFGRYLFVGIFCFSLLATPVLAVDLEGQLGKAGEVMYGEEEPTDLPTVIGRVINVLLGFLGVIMVITVIYAGYLWMTAGGDEDQVKKAKGMIRNGVAGMIIVVSAYVIVGYVMDLVMEASAN